MEYHIYGRLSIAPQVRIMSQQNSNGFPTIEEAVVFCKQNLFAWEVFSIVGNKKIYHASEK